jgi:hypothetical protein
VAGAAAIGLSLARQVPRFGSDRPDPGVYLDAVHRMRDGSGYYDAMDAAMRAGGIGPVESVRAFRLPTWFHLAQLAPSDRVLWWAFLAIVVTGTVAILARLVLHPLSALAGGAVLALEGLDGYTFPDVWAVPWVAAAWWAAARRRWWAASACGAVATGLREVALLALLAVAVEAWRRARSLRPALVALSALAVLAVVHARGAAAHLVPAGEGREAQFLGSGHGPASVADLATAWVPGGWAVGLPLYGLALWHLHRIRLLPVAAPWLALPLVGLAAHRPEWGALVVPLAVTFGVDALVDLVGQWRRQASGAGRQPDSSTPAIRNTLTVGSDSSSTRNGAVRSRVRSIVRSGAALG